MDTNSDEGRMGWLQTRAVQIIAALALILLAVVVWSERYSTRSPAASPTSAPPAMVPRQWTQLEGLFSGKINALAVDDPEGQVAVYAGTEGGVFKSLDRGRSWIACNNGLSDRLVRSLALDPDNPDVLYAGTWNGKVHASQDAGGSWGERRKGLPPLAIVALAVHTHDPRKLYAGTAAGVYTTTNSGLEWHVAAPFSGTLQCMAMDPDHPEVLYVGTAEHGVQKSRDGGATWFPIAKDLKDVTSLVIHPRSTNVVYALSEGDVYKTENNGVYWQYVDSYREPLEATSLALDPKSADIVYVGLRSGLHKSTDGRQSWYPSHLGIVDDGWQHEVQVLAVDPIDSQVIYAYAITRTLANTVTQETLSDADVGNGEFFVSTSGGQSWQQRAMVPAQDEAIILGLEADPKNGLTFYASVAGGGLYKSVDGGYVWQHVSEPLPASWITAIEIDPVNTRRVYVAIWEGYVFRSKDGGTTWEAAGRISEAQVSDLAVDREQPDRIYASTLGQGLFRSDDGGMQWERAGGDMGQDVLRIVIDARGPQTTVYALAAEGTVYGSVDSGQSWAEYLRSVADIAPSVKHGPRGDVFMPVVAPRADPGYVTGTGLSASMVVQQQVAPGVELKRLVVSRAVPTDFYALVQGQGVVRYTQAGRQPEVLGPGLEGLELRALALSVDDRDLILVGTDRGLYRYNPRE